MDKKTLTYLALGGVAGYLLCRMTDKHPLEKAADASDKAADAAAKAADAAVVSAAAAGALASGTAGYGMGRRYQVPLDIAASDKGMTEGYARLLGIKNAMLKGKRLSPRTAEWLEKVRVGGKRVIYNPDGHMDNIYFKNKDANYDIDAFSVYVGSDNAAGHQKVIDLIDAGAAVTGAQGESNWRTSWSQAHYDETLPKWKGKGYSSLGLKKKQALADYRTPYQLRGPRNLAE